MFFILVSATGRDGGGGVPFIAATELPRCDESGCLRVCVLKPDVMRVSPDTALKARRSAPTVAVPGFVDSPVPCRDWLVTLSKVVRFPMPLTTGISYAISATGASFTLAAGFCSRDSSVSMYWFSVSVPHSRSRRWVLSEAMNEEATLRELPLSLSS